MYIHDRNKNLLYIVYNENFTLVINQFSHLYNVVYKNLKKHIDYEDPDAEFKGIQIWNSKRAMNWFGEAGLKELFNDIFFGNTVFEGDEHYFINNIDLTNVT